eukprot:9487743-Pyramimonas_sp.AAC.2
MMWIPDVHCGFWKRLYAGLRVHLPSIISPGPLRTCDCELRTEDMPRVDISNGEKTSGKRERTY